MATIRKNTERATPALSTSSLPDITFMFLFFFMAVTTMKEVTFMVRIASPTASESTKLENKSLTRYVYVGPPFSNYVKTVGSETQIQLDDAFADVRDIQKYIVETRGAMKEPDQPRMIVCIKADKDTKMGIINDIKKELRQSYALRLVYAAATTATLE
jgi:Biopolymer transport protein